MHKILLYLFLTLFSITVFGNNMNNTPITTCSGNFFDSGGNAGNYSSNESFTKTFTPATAGAMLQFVFSSFSTESCCDELLIYNGPNTASPLIGTYNGTTSPGTITATNATGQLTFVFTSDGSVQNAGWAATISCVTPVLMSNGSSTGCNGIFTDPEGFSDYADFNGSLTYTFCSGTAESLEFIFSEFETREVNDNLTIYDGPTAGSPLIGTYSVTTSPGTISSTGTCLTFVWSTDANQTSGVGFTASYSCIPGPPANDNCSSAIALTVNPDELCGTTTAGTVEYATASADANSCGGTDDDDVWYSFVATSTVHTIDLLNVSGSVTDMYHSVFTGTCGSLGAALLCSDPNSSLISGLTIGNTYFVRVYTFTGTGGQNTTFDICIGTPPPPPANDNCGGATGLTVNPDLLCGTTTPGTIANATASPDANSCGGTDDDDVWFSFVATNSTHIIELLNVSGSTTDMYHAVFSGTCGSLGAALNCSDPNTSTISGLTIGNTYFVRVYTWTSTTGQNTTFDICVGTPPPPPANDDCGGAIGLTVNPNQLCGSVTSGTVASATASVDANSCFGTDDDDVWYSFVATHTTHYIDLLNVSGFTDMYHAVFSGSCGALGASIDCSDANANTVTGLTIGNTYFVRVYTYTGTAGQTATFDICIGSPPPTPTNDECATAIALSVSTGAICTTAYSSYTQGATSSMAGCTGTADDDVWFSFVAFSPVHDIDLTNFTGSSDMVMEVFSGTCGSLTSIDCSDPQSLSLTGLTPGDTYYVRVYTYGSSAVNSTFDICITSPCGAGIAPNCNLNYTSSAIAHAPVNYATGTTLSFSDDRFADAFSSIGFDFCFDGIIYSELMVSSNGYVSFPSCYTVIPGGDLSAGGSSPYTIDAAIPNNTDAPTNSIMFWQDINPSSGGVIRTNIEGTAPNRVFVVKYDNIAMYSCTSSKFSGQIMLFETSNNIELHVTEKTVCSTWNGGAAILGLNNYDGTLARTNAAHNYPTQWTETNQGYRFSSNCTNCIVSTLPIELLDFYAVSESDVNNIYWSTQSEINNDYFKIEKSVDGLNFTELEKVKGNGNINELTNYSITDKNPNETTYYRLKQFDFDGNYTSSNVVVVHNYSNGIKISSVSPNPTDGWMECKLYSENASQIEISVVDNSGRLVLREIQDLKIGQQSINLDLQRLQKGIYFVNFNTNSQNSQTFKIIKN